jgi:hypothetical protein
MVPSDHAATVENIRQFLKLHATCGGVELDTPDLPSGAGYRAVLACRCGETGEYWGHDALLPRQHLIATLTDRRIA